MFLAVAIRNLKGQLQSLLEIWRINRKKTILEVYISGGKEERSRSDVRLDSFDEGVFSENVLWLCLCANSRPPIYSLGYRWMRCPRGHTFANIATIINGFILLQLFDHYQMTRSRRKLIGEYEPAFGPAVRVPRGLARLPPLGVGPPI